MLPRRCRQIQVAQTPWATACNASSSSPAARVPELIGLEVRVAQDLALTPESWRSMLARTGLTSTPGWWPGRSRVPGGGSGSAAGCGSGWDQMELNPTTGLGTGAAAGARGFRWDLGRGRLLVSSRRRG